MNSIVDVDQFDFERVFLSKQVFDECDGRLDAAVSVFAERVGEKDLTARRRSYLKRRMARDLARVDGLKLYELELVGNKAVIPIGTIRSSHPFPEVAKRTVRRFSGTLMNLELPGWVIREKGGLGGGIALSSLRGVGK